MDILLLFKHPIILISNIFKVGVIWLADLLNWLWNPFQKFTRSMFPKRVESLDIKTAAFENNLNRFYDKGIVYNSTINWDNTVADVGDQALWHGVTVAMLGIKYSVTKDPMDLDTLRQSIVGLDLHQTAHGESVRRLIRGIQDPLNPKTTFLDDVSNDGATGHILGIYYAWKYGDDGIKQKTQILARGIAEEILNNNYCLIGPTGSSTTYGTLINGWKTDPMNLTLCMTILLVAYEITQDKKYENAYDDVKDLYGSAGLYKYPKVSFLTWNNWNDDHRAAIHLSILAELHDTETGFTDGLKRIWKLNKKTGNAWIAYLCGSHFNISKDELNPCIVLLNEFYVEEANAIQKLNPTNTLGIKYFIYRIFFWQSGDTIAKQPLPLWQTGAQDFRWQRRLYSINDWIGNTNTLQQQQFFGVDFLISYWGFKQQHWL